MTNFEEIEMEGPFVPEVGYYFQDIDNHVKFHVVKIMFVEELDNGLYLMKVVAEREELQ